MKYSNKDSATRSSFTGLSNKGGKRGDINGVKNVVSSGRRKSASGQIPTVGQQSKGPNPRSM